MDGYLFDSEEELEKALKEMVKLGLIKVMIDKNGKMIFKPTEEGKQWMEDTYR